MSLLISNRVVVFDYGEVISLTPSDRDRAELLALAGAEPETFWGSYWAHRDELDQGTLDVRSYWARVAADVGADWSIAEVQQLWACDFRGWISVEPETMELLGQLNAGGTRMALLSNAGFDFASPFRFSPMGSMFERVFVSAEMDAVKPDPVIYEEVAAGLDIELGQMVFIDNKKINTDAAERLGATVHHFTGPEGLRQFLTALAEPTAA